MTDSIEITTGDVPTWNLYEEKELLPENLWNGELKYQYSRFLSEKPITGVRLISRCPRNLHFPPRDVWIVVKKGKFASWRQPFTEQIETFLFGGNFLGVVDSLNSNYGEDWDSRYNIYPVNVRN